MMGDTTSSRPFPPSLPTRARRGLLVAAFLVGSGWLVTSLRYALRAGADSDVHRQWVVSQYVWRGHNPYQICLKALQATYGTTRGPDRIRLRHVRMWDLSGYRGDDRETGVLAELGAPVATYPPSSLLFLAAILGPLPQEALLPLWAAVNLAGLALLVPELRRHLVAARLPAPSWPVLVTMTLLWPPVHEVFRTHQFSFLVFLCALWAIRRMPTRPVQAGLLLAAALVKPSLALLFLLLPLARRAWKTIGTALAVHLAAGLGMAAWLRASPLELLRTWTEIPRYMLQGAYTLQEVLNRLEWENTGRGAILVAAFLAFVAGWVWLFRRAPVAAVLDFLCFANLLWTYHERYDFVLLLLPGLATASLAPASRARRAAAAGYALLAVALLDPIYGGVSSSTRALRWAGRLALTSLFVDAAFRLREHAVLAGPSQNRA